MNEWELLKKFYTDYVNLGARTPRPDSPYEHTYNATKSCYYQLSSQLTEETQKFLSNFIKNCEYLCALSNQESFAIGFRFGVKLMQELSSDHNSNFSSPVF